MQDIVNAAEQISLFCRLHSNTKKNMPVRSSEMGMLIYLVKTEGEKTPISVAKFFRVTKAMVTNMVSSLAKQGYITKQKSDTDKRSIFLIPTPKALSLVEETYTEYFKTMALLKEKLGEADFTLLISLIQKANESLLEDKIDA